MTAEGVSVTGFDNAKLGKDTLDFNIDRGTKVIKEFITQTINEIISDYKHLKILKDLDYYKQSSKTKQNFSKQLSANKSFKFDNEYIQKNRNILRCDEDGEKIVAKFSVDSLEKVYDKIKTKQKTELCKHYSLFHTCPFGDNCSFAHGEKQLRQGISTFQGYKTKLCKSFIEDGYCFFGTRCNYKHII